MVDFPIRVIVDTSGVERGVNRIDRRLSTLGQRLTRIQRLINTAFNFAVVGVGVRQLARLADTAIEVRNRLRIAGVATENLAAATERLFNISNQTRTPIAANAQLLGRLSLAAEALGAGQDELFQFVENVGKALAIQGSSAQQARGALIQLSQAIGAGIVRAEEFNAILEGGLPIAQAAARGLGITVAELRRQIIDGQIESNEFFRAIQSQTESIAQLFAQTTPTISQAFTILTNNFVQLISNLNQSTGVIGSFSQAVIFLANNLQNLIDIVIALGVAFLALKIGPTVLAFTLLAARVNTLNRALRLLVTILPFATAALARFNVALAFLAANPIVAVITGLGLLVAAIIKFGSAIKLTADGTVTLRTLFFSLVGVIKFVIQFMVALVNVLLRVAEIFARLAGSILVSMIDRMLTMVQIITSGVFEGWLFIWESIRAAIEAIFPPAKALFDFLASVVQFIIDLFNEFLSLLGDIGRGFIKLGQVTEREFDGIVESTKKAEAAVGGVGNAAAKAAEKTESKFKPLKSAIADPIGAGVDSATQDLDGLALTAESTADRIVAANERAAVSTARINAGRTSATGSGRGITPLSGTTGSFGASAEIKSLADALGGELRTRAGVGTPGATGGGTGLSILRDVLPTGLTREEAFRRADAVEAQLRAGQFPGISRAELAQALEVVRLFRANAAFNPSERLGPGATTGGGGFLVRGFQQGGSFTVPGLGGGDTRTVPINVTGGERVTIRRRRDAEDGGRTVVINLTQNISTPDADSFRRDRRQRNAETLRELNQVAREI